MTARHYKPHPRGEPNGFELEKRIEALEKQVKALLKALRRDRDD
jgi:hypothetical protein